MSALADHMLADGPLLDLIEDGARRQLCGGRLLLRVRLACDEVASLKEPPPLFSLAPRLAYLPFLFNDVYEHFKACLPPRMGESYEIWFDYNNVALRWQYPLGVLCDVLVGCEVPAPLDLTVHFRGGSSKELLPFSGIGDLQRVVMNAFRSSVFLERGSWAPFMKLPKHEQTQLWDAITGSNLEAFSAVHQQLLSESLAKCKSLAVRLHIYGPPHEVLLHPAGAFQNGAVCSVRCFLAQTLPPLLDTVPGGELVEGVEVLTHGVQIPLDTPLYWLALHGAYLDHFVHLVVRVPAGLLRAGSRDGRDQPPSQEGSGGGSPS